MNNDFLEIAPVTEEMMVAGKKVQVGGLSLAAIANLVVQYPALLNLLAREDDGNGNRRMKPIDAKAIAKAAPQAIADIILHGLKLEGNPKAKGIAEGLEVGDQIKLISKIIKRSLGEGGLGPLVEEVEELARLVRSAGVAELPPTLQGNSRVQ